MSREASAKSWFISVYLCWRTRRSAPTRMSRRSRTGRGALFRPRPRSPVLPELPCLPVLPVAGATYTRHPIVLQAAGRCGVLAAWQSCARHLLRVPRVPTPHPPTRRVRRVCKARGTGILPVGRPWAGRPCHGAPCPITGIGRHYAASAHRPALPGDHRQYRQSR